MGFFRFRRSFKIAPGLRANLSKSGVSTSVCRRGAWFTLGSHGSRAKVGLPGSGLSYTQTSPRRRGLGVGPVVAVIVILAIAGTAAARTCYTLLDRNDNVVYRDRFPPVDLRDQGEAARAQLRERGEYLLISEEEQCQQVTFVSGPGGSTALSVDDFLGGLQPSTRASGGTITTAPKGARGAASSAPSAPSAAPKRGSASGGYK
ncbi:MAG TPA: DUF4236 domain-containing protein [Casimicrobiaceae bacterium]|jgi:hypothetical protein|nr:DUF4236 domain-containing protein [Casimicrobiaceae bacterium]